MDGATVAPVVNVAGVTDFGNDTGVMDGATVAPVVNVAGVTDNAYHTGGQRAFSMASWRSFGNDRNSLRCCCVASR